MSRSDHVYRFAVGGPTEPRSSVWRLWAHTGASGDVDVYLGVRAAAGRFKVSFHASGVCQEAVTTEFLNLPAVAATLGDGPRPAQRWNRELRTHREALIYALLVPHHYLRIEPGGNEKLDGVSWHSPPGPCAIRVFNLTAQATGEPPTKSDALVVWELATGETIRLYKALAPMSDGFYEQLKAAEARLRNAGGLALDGELPEGPNRMAMWMTRAEDGLRFVVDAPVTIVRIQQK